MREFEIRRRGRTVDMRDLSFAEIMALDDRNYGKLRKHRRTFDTSARGQIFRLERREALAINLGRPTA